MMFIRFFYIQTISKHKKKYLEKIYNLKIIYPTTKGNKLQKNYTQFNNKL